MWLLSAALRSNAADYVLPLFIFIFYFIFFIHRSFSETTRPILTKFSGIVYSGVKNIYQNLFSCWGINCWNSLANDIVNVSSLNIFKSKLNKIELDRYLYGRV